MGNREKRVKLDSVHMLLAFQRVSHEGKHDCIRMVDRGKGDEVDVLTSKLKVLGGNWRIHRTVNARCVNKAMKILQHKLIDHQECASYIDTEWRTALLQKNCIYGEKKFMLDIDTDDGVKIEIIEEMIYRNNGEIYEKHKSPKGWHYITNTFDTREVCSIDDVTLLRDGYYYITSVSEDKNYA